MRKCYLLLPFLFSTFSANATENEKELIFKIEEMHCQLCVYLVNKEVRNIEGVKTTKASLKERKLTVTTAQNVLDEEIAKAIRKLNYTPELVK